MLELAEKVQALVGSKLPIVFNPLPVDDPKQRCPDISKAKKYLNNWEPKVQLREGLEKSLAYFRKNLG
jgi:UDP-glucuronate decarboxylase